MMCDIHLGDDVALCIYMHVYISPLFVLVPCELGLPSHLFTDVLDIINVMNCFTDQQLA